MSGSTPRLVEAENCSFRMAQSLRKCAWFKELKGVTNTCPVEQWERCVRLGPEQRRHWAG